MTSYDKALTVFAGAALVIAGATAAYAGPRCPDQQMSESGRSKVKFAKYGDWQVSDAGPYSYRYDFQPLRVASPAKQGFLMLTNQC